MYLKNSSSVLEVLSHYLAFSEYFFCSVADVSVFLMQELTPFQNNSYFPAWLVKCNVINRTRKCLSLFLKEECHKMSS